MKTVCLIFDSDSQFFACANLVEPFRRAGWSITLLSIARYAPPPDLIPPGCEWRETEFPEAIPELPGVMDHDAFGVYLPGSKLRRVHNIVSDWFSLHNRRPVLFTGYNGVVLMKFEEGMSWRVGYDFVALNSTEDERKTIEFLRHCAVPRVISTPIIGIDRKRRGSRWLPDHDPEWKNRKRLIFAEQVAFPKTNREKFYLYSHLIRIALENPEWEIVVKPRTAPGGTTFHEQETHVSRFLAKHFKPPGNFLVSYENLDLQMARSTALLSISSTAFFDAVGSGLPAFILSDFGINNNYGTHFFHGSGCSLCLADLAKLDHETFQHRPTGEWLAYKGFDPQFNVDLLVSEIDGAISRRLCDTPPPAIETEQRLLGLPADLPPGYAIPPRLTWRRLKKKIRTAIQAYRNRHDNPEASAPVRNG